MANEVRSQTRRMSDVIGTAYLQSIFDQGIPSRLDGRAHPPRDVDVSSSYLLVAPVCTRKEFLLRPATFCAPADRYCRCQWCKISHPQTSVETASRGMSLKVVNFESRRHHVASTVCWEEPTEPLALFTGPHNTDWRKSGTLRPWTLALGRHAGSPADSLPTRSLGLLPCAHNAENRRTARSLAMYEHRHAGTRTRAEGHFNARQRNKAKIQIARF